jgi:hypothetical protein
MIKRMIKLRHAEVVGHSDIGDHWWSEHQIFHLVTLGRLPCGLPRDAQLRAADHKVCAHRSAWSDECDSRMSVGC